MSWIQGKGYKVIDVPMGLGMSVHSFYIKEHVDQKSHNENGKVLFVGNVDYCRFRSLDEINAMLRILFANFGEVESIAVSEFKPKEGPSFTHSTRFAHVTFRKRSDVKAVLLASYDMFVQAGSEIITRFGLISGGSTSLLGKRTNSNLFAAMHGGGGTYESTLAIRQVVNEQLKDFEERELIDQQERQRRSQLMDDDGFTQVKVRNKKRKLEDGRSKGKQRSRTTKKATELTNFYRFQIREDKRSRLLELREKFEEDKQRIAILKANRKFKPF